MSYDFHEAHLPRPPSAAAAEYRKASRLPPLASQSELDLAARRRLRPPGPWCTWRELASDFAAVLCLFCIGYGSALILYALD